MPYPSQSSKTKRSVLGHEVTVDRTRHGPTASAGKRVDTPCRGCVSAWQATWLDCGAQRPVPSNTGMQRTALRAREIAAFLKVRIGSPPVPIYRCAAADAQPVGPVLSQPCCTCTKQRAHMYLPDLSPIQQVPEWPVLSSVGWLEPPHPYTQGSTSPAFQERLFRFCIHPAFYTMGIHACPYCTDDSAQRYTFPDGDYIRFGSVEVWVFDTADRVYAAPGLIYHYVQAHQYCPPQEFVQALMRCPIPTSPTYRYQKAVAMGRQPPAQQGTRSVVSRITQWWQRRRDTRG